MLSKIKEKIKKNSFFKKSKEHKKSILKVNVFYLISWFSFYFLILGLVGLTFFFNPRIEFNLSDNNEIKKEPAPFYIIEDLKNFKENSILTRENILKYKVDKEEFLNALLEKEKEYLKDKKYSLEEKKEYLKSVKEKINSDLELVEEGLFFIINNKNSKEIIATNKNGFIGYYNKEVFNEQNKEQEYFNNIIKNIKFINDKNYYEKKYKDLEISKRKINNKEVFDIRETINKFEIREEMKNNYMIDQFIKQKKYNFHVLNQLNKIEYTTVDEKIKNIYYYNANIKGSFTNYNNIKKDLEKALIEATEELNAVINDMIISSIFSLMLMILFLYGYKREVKILREIENKELSKSDKNTEIINKEEVEVEEVKVEVIKI